MPQSNNFDDAYSFDNNFRPDEFAMMTVTEGKAGDLARAGRMETGEFWNAAKYDEMNQTFQDKTMQEPAHPADGEEPFFLRHWPMVPLDNTRAGRSGPVSLNQGKYVDKMQLLDTWLAEIFNETDALGVADNTVVVLMRNNGHFAKCSPLFGATLMIFRVGKAETTERHLPVDTFIRWPCIIEEDCLLNSIIHVSDLYTTLARFVDADQIVRRDRLVDGVDQSTSRLFSDGNKYRRDHVIIYSISSPRAIVKNPLKLALPAPSERAIASEYNDLFRDKREEYPVSTEDGTWDVQEFVRILGRHFARKNLRPDTPSAFGIPNTGNENIRPEAQVAVDAFVVRRGKAVAHKYCQEAAACGFSNTRKMKEN